MSHVRGRQPPATIHYADHYSEPKTVYRANTKGMVIALGVIALVSWLWAAILWVTG